MSFPTSISRLTVFYRRHGFSATTRRIRLAVYRALFSNRSAIFYCDLSTQTALPANLPSSLKIERKQSASDLDLQDLEAITSFWNPKLARRSIKERFESGASLWLMRSGDKLAGYGWTLTGQTIQPHFFQLGAADVHLFDFHVFPPHRGRGLNPLLVTNILRCLSREAAGRAFIEAAEWNTSQLISLSRTPFHPLGWARKVAIFGNSFVWWRPDSPDARLAQFVQGVPRSIKTKGNQRDVTLVTENPHV